MRLLWVTFGSQLDEKLATECMHIAFDAGVNFFDNAGAYAGGHSEEIMERIEGILDNRPAPEQDWR